MRRTAAILGRELQKTYLLILTATHQDVKKSSGYAARIRMSTFMGFRNCYTKLCSETGYLYHQNLFSCPLISTSHYIYVSFVIIKHSARLSCTEAATGLEVTVRKMANDTRGKKNCLVNLKSGFPLSILSFTYSICQKPHVGDN